MRAPTVTATTVTVAPAAGGTMFGITNAHLVQSLSGPASTGTIGLPPIKADSPTGPVQLTSSGGTGRVKVNRASSVCGPGPGMMLVSSLKASSRSGTSSPVKRNSSSSSSFGSSSDRRSIFYTDTEPEQGSKTQTSKQYDGVVNDESCSASKIYTLAPVTTTSGSDVDEVKQPRQDRRKMAATGNGGTAGVRAEELLRRLGDGQVRSKQQRPSSTGLEGVIGPKAHLKLVSQELEWERKLRDDQLSRILKALIGFENRLKNEQNRIRQQLYEKDDVINRQNCTINRMKRKLAAEEAELPTAGAEDEEGKKKAEEECSGRDDEVTQYCPKCRKNYYRLEYRANGTQTFDYCRDDGAESVNTENLSLNSVEYASSSEEQESSLYVRANSFKDARRSRKYTSKRSYQGYQRGPSRASSFKSNASGQTTGTLTRLTERNERASPLRFDGQQREDDEDDEQPERPVVESGHEAYVNIEPAMPKIAIYENYESDKENKRLDQNRRSECNNYDNVEPYSNRIDSLHGINRNPGEGGDGILRKHFIRDELPTTEGIAASSEQMELDDGTIFYEANTSGGSVGNNQQKYTEGMEMKQTIETNDDWYASASDMEDSDTALGKPYSNAAVNPVLECVNQILLQQSMDGFGDSNNNKDNTPGGDGAEDEEELYIRAQEPSVPVAAVQGPPKEHPQTTVRSKRVHFSTQNSMVQVPRISLQSSLSNGGSRKDDKLSPTYEIQSIYSNEYEPIGSEHNSYSNYYVDMESKLGSEDRERELALAEKRKTPPALPPKPANLLKLQQLSKNTQHQQQQHQQQQQRQTTPQGSKMTSPRSPSSVAHSDITESEPDYCSISEIQDSVKCVQIVAEIHKDACEDDYSIVGEEEDGTLARAGKQTSTSELLEESFADVPKLPNVAEIVPPVKKEPLNKYISQDNYITKSISSVSSTNSGASGGNKLASNGTVAGTVVSAVASSVLGTPSKKDGEFREQLSEIIAEINKQSPAIRNASKKQVPVKELGSPFRGVSQIPSVTFQSKLKPVDKLSFLSKVPGSGAGARVSSTHHTPKLSTSIGRPAALKPTLLKSSLSQKALSSTNLTLGSPFGSPSKSSVSYIPNLKPSSVAASSSAAAGTNGSPAKTSSSPKKATNGTSNGNATGSGVVSSTTNAQLSPTSPQLSVASAATTAAPPPPVIIAEDSKLPIQAEFDWYNLDAEYGKSSQPDVIVEADNVSNPDQETTGTDRDTAMECRKLQNAVGCAKTDDLLLNGNAAGPSNPENQSNGSGVEEEQEDELENVEYNLDEEYKSVAPMVPPPDIIQKSSVHTPPITPPKSGKIPYNSLSFKELMQLNETPKAVGATEKAKTKATGTAASSVENGNGTGTGNYEHFLDDSGLCSKPIILPRKKRVYYSGPFV
ncbi:uncharacterized protein LOC125949905 [Anopheles darlingi]|uniref:uncharacterized protein LOC125949905 n=1 Tax=Anopheles darlingi TaxID=43151 RepID=UPI0021002CED|nr:uncharacterized protein LOC125949905 [Anopheles darlingi]